jgi:hypothetical protein
MSTTAYFLLSYWLTPCALNHYRYSANDLITVPNYSVATQRRPRACVLALPKQR